MMKAIRTIAMAAMLIGSAGLVFAQDDYAEGQRALRQQDWEQAYAAFTRAAEAESVKADAATYWRGYSLFKAGRDRDAKRVLKKFDKRFPGSKWADDVQVLLAEHNGESTTGSTGTSDLIDEETRLFILAQLMERDPDRALPLLRDLLKDSATLRDRGARRNALFIVAMSDDEQAQRLISDIARDSSDPKLQIEAIQVLGTSDTDQAMGLITEIYQSSDSLDVKRAALQASMVAEESSLALEILRSEQDAKLRIEAIQTLGVMEETGELHKLYSQFDDRRVREAVLQALMVADDTSGLRALVDAETDPELRRAAIRNLAMTGELDSVEALEQLYDSARSVEERRAVIEALYVVGDDAQALALKIAENESHPQLRGQAIQALGVMDAPEALLELYPQLSDRELKEAVLQGLVIADASDELVGLLSAESDPELRAMLIQRIAVTEDEDAARVLVESYASARAEEKHAIINAMMIMEDAQALISMLRSEQDRELKQRILQTLVMIDSDEATEYLLKTLENEQ